MVSPATAAAFEVYLILITWLLKEPESKEPVAPLVPSGNDHDQPVAPTGNADAEYLYTLGPHALVFAAATVTVGAAGTGNAVLVSFVAFDVPKPQAEVNATRMVSPATAAAFEVYVTVMVCDVAVPESLVPVDPTVPSGFDHDQPDAAAAVAVAAGKADAEYLYLLAPHVLTDIGVTVTNGAAGALIKVFVNLIDFLGLLPQPELAITFMLSVVNAARFDTNFNLMALPFETVVSTVTPDTPPTEVGKVQV